ncbi:hypothetical protein BJ684DRAFT_14290 [Piptocephalis cylindrospora]|uniref:Uncharacterized protein n=1 Tax=Piptocephalis cylindrospora TaxID=1907219 RepID=A0A4P9Y8H0_9FUNG|nr:hypothetical protein BJ684DRAFT_14290 [Piptocephalis cylindrospora]|eukprot:RKP15466.1 hypothetical protein BJ684DRAFT_14290 [Piptocephalis cylindrospora]
MTRSSTFALPKALAALVPRGKQAALTPIETHLPQIIPTEEVTMAQIAHGKNHPLLPTLPGEITAAIVGKDKDDTSNAEKRKAHPVKIPSSPLSIGPDACDSKERQRLLEPLVGCVDKERRAWEAEGNEAVPGGGYALGLFWLHAITCLCSPLSPALRTWMFMCGYFLAESAIRLYENPTLPTHPITPPLQALPNLNAFLLSMVTPTEMPLGSITLALLYLERLRLILPSTIRGGRGTAHRLALAALVLANKWSDDDSFGVRTWSKLVRRWFARGEVELMEAEMLARMSWRLFVPRSEWEDFLTELEGKLGIPLRQAIGPELTNGECTEMAEADDEERDRFGLEEQTKPVPQDDEGLVHEEESKRRGSPPGPMITAVQAKASLSWTPDVNALGIIEGMVASREHAGRRLRDALRDATEKRVNSGRPPVSQPSSAGSSTTAMDSTSSSIRTVDSGVVGMEEVSKSH